MKTKALAREPSPSAPDVEAALFPPDRGFAGPSDTGSTTFPLDPEAPAHRSEALSPWEHPA
jgi:hypothetical protein